MPAPAHQHERRFLHIETVDMGQAGGGNRMIIFMLAALMILFVVKNVYLLFQTIFLSSCARSFIYTTISFPVIALLPISLRQFNDGKPAGLYVLPFYER